MNCIYQDTVLALAAQHIVPTALGVVLMEDAFMEHVLQGLRP